MYVYRTCVCISCICMFIEHVCITCMCIKHVDVFLILAYDVMQRKLYRVCRDHISPKLNPWSIALETDVQCGKDMEGSTKVGSRLDDLAWVCWESMLHCGVKGRSWESMLDYWVKCRSWGSFLHCWVKSRSWRSMFDCGVKGRRRNRINKNGLHMHMQWATWKFNNCLW